MEERITSLNDQGQGVCFVNDKITFIDNALPDEVVDIEITKENSKYQEGKVLKYLKKSLKRKDAFCSYFNKCGGCQLQNLSYEDTLSFKKEKLQRILHKFAKIDNDIEIIPSKNEKNYRNKIRLQVKNKKIGYFSYKTNELVEIKMCPIASSSINEIIKELPKFNACNGEIVIRSNYNDELLLHFITNDSINIPDLSNYKIVGIVQNDKTLKGDNHFMELVNNKFFEVSYDSFFQVNRGICEEIFKIIKENILKNKIVLDLYCGVGTLGINVADISKKVYGIEIVENAIINALKNSKINKVNNVSYLLGDASKIINKINDNIDVLILDPPRSGVSKNEIELFLKNDIKQIIYVSCDPITLARDLNLLKDKYDINKVIALDMFPYTYHCESVCILGKESL